MKKLSLIVVGILLALAMPLGAATQHGIDLTWQESTQGTSFNVYRGTSPGGEGATPYASVGVGVLAYLDTNGTPGTKYYYVVTSVLNGIESAPSGEASAVFPTVPAPPTALGAAPQ